MSSPKPIKDMNILIVDDEDKICEIMRVFLMTLGPFKSIVVADSALRAMQMFQNQNFDLVILDHVMPGKLGIDFAESLRKSIKFHNLRILLVSGFLQQEDVLHSVEIGIKHILVKPFTRQQLVEKVAQILELPHP